MTTDSATGTDAEMNASLPSRPKLFLKRVLVPYRRQFIVFFILSGLGITAFTATPFIIRNLIDHLTGAQVVMATVWWLVAWFGILRLLDEWLWRFAENYVRGFLPRLQEGVRLQLFRATLRKRHAFFVNASSGQTGQWIDTATRSTRELITTTIWTVWNRSYGFLVSAVFLAIANWLLAVIFFGWILSLVAVIVWRGRRTAKLEEELSDSLSVAGGYVVDAVSNNVPVRVFAARRREAVRLGDQQEEIISRWRRSWWYEIVTNMFKGNSAAIVSTGCLALIVSLYMDGKVTIGDIALLITYVTSTSETIWDLSFQLDTYFRNYGSLKNALHGLLDNTDERDDGKPLQARKLGLRFRRLHFAYPDQTDLDVLRGIDFEVPAGTKVGIVGHSGAGKSTLVGLLLGLYEPTKGKLLYNDTDIRELSLDSVRRHIAYVPQDASLFNRTIRQNIAYGAAGDPSDAQIRTAAARAQALDFIEALPDGFDSLVGERGVKLSGGQKQRIAIARAMLSDAPLVLLDEATSALDSASEQSIQKALAEIMKDRTAVVIAHRLSTLKHLDCIYVFDKGRIAESGTHDELLQKGGIYADLWHRQRNGFIGE